jgi:hypothetical protein
LMVIRNAHLRMCGKDAGGLNHVVVPQTLRKKTVQLIKTAVEEGRAVVRELRGHKRKAE